MRRLFVVLLAFTVVLMLDPVSVNGQLFRRSTNGQPRPVIPSSTTSVADNPLFNPQVQSLWHQLGIPQSVGRYKKWRESRVNRNGNHPERETKPQLLKLTDPANMAEGAPDMLKAAAQIKMAEDLAPQKLKALKYLGTIGCGCYNEQGAGLVEAALMEGLEDCTSEVRIAALNVILKQVSGGCCTCSCESSSCNAKSCCTYKLYKKLDEIANKVDDYGCPIEPDANVRALACTVLNACPPPPVPDSEEKETVEQETKLDEGAEGEREGAEDDGDDPEVNAPAGDDASNDESTYYRRRHATSNVSYSRLPGTPSLNNYSAADREFLQQLEITGIVSAIELNSGFAKIEFDDPYELPQGLNIVIAKDRNNVSFGVIEATQRGAVVVKVEDFAVLNQFAAKTRIRMGIYQ